MRVLINHQRKVLFLLPGVYLKQDVMNYFVTVYYIWLARGSMLSTLAVITAFIFQILNCEFFYEETYLWTLGY